MGKYADKKWYLEASKKCIDQYGFVPPPWVYGPNMHPYSIGWRMGGGESHIMVLSEWLDQQNYTKEQRIDYLRTFPPPPRWLKWAAQFIWKEEQIDDYTAYFKELELLGFEGIEDFKKDYEDDNYD